MAKKNLHPLFYAKWNIVIKDKAEALNASFCLSLQEKDGLSASSLSWWTGTGAEQTACNPGGSSKVTRRAT